MTRLDENRAKAQLAIKAGAGVGAVSNLGIWGNHSPTMFPDFYNAKIGGQPVTAVIQDENWLKTTFVTTVAQRGHGGVERAENEQRGQRGQRGH